MPGAKRATSKTSATGNSTLDDMFARDAKRAGPHREAKQRAGKRELLSGPITSSSPKLGVPSLYLGSKPKDFIGKPADYGQKKSDDYTLHHYHQVSDEVNPAWDLSGAVQDDSACSSKSAIRSRMAINIRLGCRARSSRQSATR